MAANKKRKYPNAHRGCPGGPKCRHCTWDSVHISVDGPHAKYIKGDRGEYRGDIDAAIDDFIATLKLDVRQLLRECAKITPVLAQFHLDFS
jgi:hypothetical protein